MALHWLKSGPQAWVVTCLKKWPGDMGVDPREQQGEKQSNFSPPVKIGGQKSWGMGLCLYLYQ